MKRGSGPAAADVAAAVAALAAGDMVGLPTETVYGLAADAANPAAIATVYRVKGRPADHPLIVHVLGASQARQWAHWSDAAQRLADAWWPGPLTIVLRRRADAPGWACAGQPTIALRAPSHPIARQVLEGLLAQGITGIAAPSANRFGRVSPTSAAHVRADLGDDVAVVLDGGDAAVGIESTIVDLSRGQPALLRPGHIGADAVSHVLGVPVAPPGDDAPRVPGALPSHYAPVTPLELVATANLAPRLAQARASGRRVAVWSVVPLAAGRSAAHGSAAVESAADEPAAADAVRWHPRPDSVAGMEQTLYRTLRALDSWGVDLILVEAPPATAPWAAIMDRLRRAAAT